VTGGRLTQSEQRARRGEQAEHQSRPVAQLLHCLDQAHRFDPQTIDHEQVGIGVAHLGRDRRPLRRTRRVRNVGRDLEPALLRDRDRTRLLDVGAAM
jgi:hypothetical protein